MIRKLVELDRNSLINFLDLEKSLNIYFHANIMFFGDIEDGDLTFYGEFDELGNYLSVMLFVKTSVIFYSKNRSFNNEWLKLLESFKFAYIHGVEDVINKIAPYYKDCEVQSSFCAEASILKEKHKTTSYNIAKITRKDQYEKLYDLLNSMDEFVHRTKNKDEFVSIRMKAMKMGCTYIIEENNKVISTATVSSETESNALVSMVATDVDYRNRGLASIILKYIMHDYIEKKKKNLCLFYDNLNAGKIYKRLGFKDVDNWGVIFGK